MDIKKLDTLLQNKLHRHESLVRDEELDGIFDGLGLKKKRSFFMFKRATAIVLLFVVAVMTFLYSLQQKATEQSVAEVHNETVSQSDINKDLVMDRSEESQTNIQEQPSFHKPRIQNPIVLESLTDFSLALHEVIPISTLESEQDKYSKIYGITMLSYPGKEFEQLSFQYVKEKGFIAERKKSLSQRLQPELCFWISPAQNAAKVETMESDKIHKDYAALEASSRKNMWTLNAGTQLSIAAFSFLRFGSGVSYYSTGSRYNADYKINNVPVFDSASGRILAYIQKPDSASRHIQTNNRNRVSYIEIPISLRLHLLTWKNVKLGLEPMYNIHFFLGSKGKHIDASTLSLSDRNTYKNRLGSVQLGLRIEQKIGLHSSLVLSPFYGQINGNAGILNNQNIQQRFAGIRIAWNYTLY